ncbi:hypothetical protein PIB30_020082 [Stylosanthes scabra]|uniref:Uncharacterized protein n=1 Tax=Stylosanthes scabra TaxID=79078 RepID=A0ABU6VA12_9FABA|nr:hypothetical protein [Stylosanthes scabra]
MELQRGYENSLYRTDASGHIVARIAHMEPRLYALGAAYWCGLMNVSWTCSD